ncbi:MAG: IS21 family transposase [Anaerolineaceae bacterium]|nr:IS21 family transposase [Anaerolineaceae bacterium]
MSNEINRNDPLAIITQVLDDMQKEQDNDFDMEKVNLAELERRTGISRSRLRTLKSKGFRTAVHGLSGRKADSTVLTGFTGIIDNQLKAGVTNSAVIYERLEDEGYTGSLTTVKNYIAEHKNLVPAKRKVVSDQGNRGQRYETQPGEVQQIDWGFINVSVKNKTGKVFRAACFAQICHHCGSSYVEFFPNARQENLFIGMTHGFLQLGVPQYILTDNMKSVVISRDMNGSPVWQHDYESYMKTAGFETKLCKPRHPFTKGKVERLIRFVKDNFLAGRYFWNYTDLNLDAQAWCNRQNNKYHKATDCIPSKLHQTACRSNCHDLDLSDSLNMYLCPERRISFDGFVNYEGRRFGVPYWYPDKICRVQRYEDKIRIWADDLSRVLAVHDVTWSKKDSFCKDQYVTVQPEERPTMQVKTFIQQKDEPEHNPGFSKFDFSKGGIHG